MTGIILMIFYYSLLFIRCVDISVGIGMQYCVVM